MEKNDCTCENGNGFCGCDDINGIQIIKDLNKIKSFVFNFTQNEIRRILFYAGVIRSHFQHSGIVQNFGYLEKNHACPACRIKQAKKIQEGGKNFYVFFQKTPTGLTDGICTIYPAE